MALGPEGVGSDRRASRGDGRVGDGPPGEPAGPTTVRSDDARGVEAIVLNAVGWEPTSTEALLRRTGMKLGEAAVVLDRLAQAGLVRDGGGWWERLSGGPGR